PSNATSRYRPAITEPGTNRCDGVGVRSPGPQLRARVSADAPSIVGSSSSDGDTGRFYWRNINETETDCRDSGGGGRVRNRAGARIPFAESDRHGGHTGWREVRGRRRGAAVPR